MSHRSCFMDSHFLGVKWIPASWVNSALWLLRDSSRASGCQTGLLTQTILTEAFLTGQH